MLKLNWIEFFLRTLPELLIIVWGVHIISKRPINIPKYILSSIVLSILTFFVRWLPIYFGMHMIINILLITSIMILIDIPIIKSIYSTLLMFFVLTLGELLNIIILNLLDKNVKAILINPLIKFIYFLPSLIFLLLFVIIMNYLQKMNKREKDISKLKR